MTEARLKELPAAVQTSKQVATCLVGVLSIVLLSNYPLFWLQQTRPAFRGLLEARVPILLLGSSFVLGRTPNDKLTAAIKRSWPVLMLVAFAAYSTIWSVDPAMTLRSLIEPVTGYLVVLAISLYFPMTQLFQVVAFAGLGLLLLNSYACLAAPELMVFDGWGGLTGNRNGLAMNTVVFLPYLLSALAGSSLIGRVVRYGYFGVGALLTLFVLYKTGSKTSMVCVILSFFLYSLFVTARVTRKLEIAPRIAVRAVSGLIAVTATAIVVKSLFRAGYLRWDTTFTMRTPIWKSSLVLDKQVWRSGIGYAGWASGKGNFQQYTWDKAGENLSHLHNGYLQQLLDLGVVGLLLLVACFGVLLWRWATRCSYRFPLSASFGLISTIGFAITNITESRALWPTFDLMWPMFCLLAVLQIPTTAAVPRIPQANRSKRPLAISIIAFIALVVPLTAPRPLVYTYTPSAAVVRSIDLAP
jgi:exopolysaccharide production protein ExoQ